VDLISGYLDHESLLVRIIMLAILVIAAHLTVVGIRFLTNDAILKDRLKTRKARSVISLATSALIFTLYFLSIGLILKEMGVPLTAYLASASVIGLAVGFGSQGIVQDVVMGLTFVFSDMLDVGDLVEVSGQTGRVTRITMRFVELENALGAIVFIPNRTINNITNYLRGYVRCLVDVTLIGDPEQKDKMAARATAMMPGLFDQFPGILLTEPVLVGRFSTTGGKEYLRIKFRIWPNRGQPIETIFVKELGLELRKIADIYQDWMVAVTYEVEKREAPIR